MRKIPEKIFQVSNLPDERRQYIKYLGLYKGREAYCYAVPNLITGFPTVYLDDGAEIETIYGFEALEIASSFVKD